MSRVNISMSKKYCEELEKMLTDQFTSEDYDQEQVMMDLFRLALKKGSLTLPEDYDPVRLFKEINEA